MHDDPAQAGFFFRCPALVDQLIANAHACAVLAFTVLALGLHLFPYSRNGEEPGLRQIYSGFGHEELVAIC